ncbi:hypothetical protein JCM18882A_30400 [Brevibacterium metallidurans]|uniref:Uncharacterized protein n=1 Tax=Brevibacterium metallidurans TaxID=1482676 RepID=A0ABN0SN35_9MICO
MVSAGRFGWWFACPGDALRLEVRSGWRLRWAFGARIIACARILVGEDRVDVDRPGIVGAVSIGIDLVFLRRPGTGGAAADGMIAAVDSHVRGGGDRDGRFRTLIG